MTKQQQQIEFNVDYNMGLVDAWDEKSILNIRVRKSPGNGILLIGADGYGEMTALGGEGFPIAIELYEGELRLLIWANINSEEPSHIISMEEAKDSNRKDYSGDFAI